MSFRALLAVWMSKFVTIGLKIMGRGATSLPGVIAQRVYLLLPDRLLRQIDTCVIVTGTNGKTTTTELLYAMLHSDDEPWLVNRGGANLIQGILATLLQKTNWRGRLTVKRVLLEVDEATMRLVLPSIRPQVLVLTNVLRDQLDRYGEIDQTIMLLRNAAWGADTTLVTNADDPLCVAISSINQKPVFFGYAPMESTDETSVVDLVSGNQVRDGAFCEKCGALLSYERYFYGQMGIYACPECSFKRPELSFAGRVLDAGTAASQLCVNEYAATQDWRPSEDREFLVPNPLKGLYNAYNLLAATSAARTLGVSPSRIAEASKRFIQPLGRMQVFPGHPERILSLIKNPTGADSVLSTVAQDERGKMVCFVINDNFADGRDVSWLWDVDLEVFVENSPSTRYVCAGTRAADMALRLAYAGVDRLDIKIVDDTEALLLVGNEEALPVYVLSTYTALHPLVSLLTHAQPKEFRGKAVSAS